MDELPPLDIDVGASDLPEQIIAIDFAGTLIKAEIIEEANEYRAKILEKALPSSNEHANPEELYKVNREFVGKLTGIREEHKIKYMTNEYHEMLLSGKQVQTQIATNLFQIGMYVVAKRHYNNIYPTGLLDQLRKLRDRGFKLMIFSGVREDIISGMLAITGQSYLFDYIMGQPPVLGDSNESKLMVPGITGKLHYVIGDKMSDLEPGKKWGGVTIFVKWGHPSGGEEEFADHTISEPSQLSDIILK